MSKKIWIPLIILIALPLSFFAVEKQLTQGRKIASTESISSESLRNEDKDLSEASPQEFHKAFKYQLVKDAKVVISQGNPAVQVGLFLLKNSAGNKVFVCDEFPTVDLIFAAEGVAFSGEIPHMILRGPCLVSPDQSHMELFPIPWAQILTSPLNQYQFSSSIPNSRENMQIYFRNVVEFWPQDWVFVGIKLYGRNPEKTLEVNGYEIISILGEPLGLKATTE